MQQFTVPQFIDVEDKIIDIKIYLYDNTNKAIFQFSLPCNNEGKQNVNKLLAALSVLIPHAQEEYNEEDTHMYTNPMPF